MRVTANQLTLARFLLLPVPVTMVYHGVALTGAARSLWLVGALAVYVLLGLTDALDGMLARRHGSTPLGALLDPIVDKIFLVATYVTMADLGMTSGTLVIVLFVRELAVTALRSIALEERFSFRTTRLAKLKTTVQMAGAGFILLIWLFPEARVIRPIMATAAAAALVPSSVALLRGRRPGWRSVSAAVLIGGIALVRFSLDRQTTLNLTMLGVTALTVLSGVQYFWAMRSVLAGRFRRAPLELLRLAGLSVAVPVGFLPVLGWPGAPVFGIMAVLAAELAMGGLDNFLVQSGRPTGRGWDLLRAAVQAAVGGAMILILGGPASAWPVSLLLPWAAALVTVAGLAAILVRSRAALRLSGSESGF